MKGSLAERRPARAGRGPDSGLRTETRLTHACVLDLPGLDRATRCSPTASSTSTPNLAAKRDIVQQHPRLAQAMGIATPHVALLARDGRLSHAFPSTTDAVALKSMAAQGLFGSALVEGPLRPTRRSRHPRPGARRVAGHADVLIAPSDGNGDHGAAHAHRRSRRGSPRGIVLGAGCRSCCRRAPRYDRSAHGVVRARVADVVGKRASAPPATHAPAAPAVARNRGLDRARQRQRGSRAMTPQRPYARGTGATRHHRALPRRLAPRAHHPRLPVAVPRVAPPRQSANAARRDLIAGLVSARASCCRRASLRDARRHAAANTACTARCCRRSSARCGARRGTWCRARRTRRR